jgi:uncharacterized protein YdiU (UPF0061 family)
MQDLHALMRASEIDMTLFFRALSDAAAGELSVARFADAFYDEDKRAAAMQSMDEWLARYRQRLDEDPQSPEQRRAHMRAVNPRYVLRNWLAQQAIDRAHAGDESGIHELLDVMRRPYDDQPGCESFAARRPDWARNKAGCSMLSCSS